MLSAWDEDPWVGAAYSISPAAGLAQALAEPVGPLAFAGEHIGGRFNGLMEGAIRSGRAAAAALDALDVRLAARDERRDRSRRAASRGSSS